MPPPGQTSDLLRVALEPKADSQRRWCSGAVFEATIAYTGRKSIWLELGKPEEHLRPSGFSIAWSKGNGGSGQGVASGLSEERSAIAVLRGPDATILRPGQTVTRIVVLERAALRTGQVILQFTFRIRGTENLEDDNVVAYRPTASIELLVHRRGRCLEVRRPPERRRPG
jgi:hypothetical protein